MDFIKDYSEKLNLQKVKEEKKYISILVAVLLMLISIIYYNVEKNNPNIHKGIKVLNISVSNLSKSDATKFLDEKLKEEIKNKKMHFYYDDANEEKNIFISYKDLGYFYNIDKAVDDAYNVGRSDSLINNYFNIVLGGIFKHNIKPEYSYDKNSVDEKILALSDEIYIKPEDAYLDINKDNSVTIKKEKIGRYLDNKEIKQLILENFDKNSKIKLPIYTTEPNIKSNYFSGINKLLGVFSTDYSSSTKNRKANIALASSFFDNLIIKPEEEISFNNRVGEITSDTGFKNATVIVNGEYEDGVGGGICQVSTTLYNALIRADLEIIERYNHSRPIKYVKLGTDAAVAAGYKDLKFKNNTDKNILIKAYSDGKKLEFQIFGDGSNRDYDYVKIIPIKTDTVAPKVIEKYSNSLYEGDSKVEKSGSYGYSYVTYREFLKDGEIIKKDELKSSYYIPQDKVVIVGTRENSNEDQEDDK